MKDKKTLNNLDIKHFLANVWQQKPLVIRNAIQEQEAPLNPNELAGLACEEQVDSRLIYNSENDRQIKVEDGPFSEDKFSTMPGSHWSLMVQKTENWHEEVFELRKCFDFILLRKVNIY